MITPDHESAAGALCVDDGTGCCVACGVALTTCNVCGGIGYHRGGCRESEDSMSWTVWILWADRSDVLIVLRPIDGATSSEHACEIAVRRGHVSGFGADRRYLGLHAVIR